MIHELWLHWQFIKMRLAQRMAYRADFILGAFAFFLFQFIAPIVVGVIYFAGGEFPGWTMNTILLLQGILALVRGFSFMFFVGILWNTHIKIRKGTLDLLLLRPINTLWLFIMDSFDEEDVGQVLGGVVITAFALSRIGELPGSIALCILLAIVGVLFILSLALISSALTIVFVKTHRIYEFIDLIMTFASYPKTIYNKTLSVAFSVVLPLFVMSYYPASALLGRSLELAVPSVFVTLGLVLFSIWVWYKALKSYKSAGG